MKNRKLYQSLSLKKRLMGLLSWLRGKKETKSLTASRESAALQAEWNKERKRFVVLGKQSAAVEAWARQEWRKLQRLYIEAELVEQDHPKAIDTFREKLLTIQDRLGELEWKLEEKQKEQTTALTQTKLAIIGKILNRVERLGERLDRIDMRKRRSGKYAFEH